MPDELPHDEPPHDDPPHVDPPHDDPPHDEERAAKLDAALAESQRLEREERDADLARQVKTDEALSEALAKRPTRED